MLSKKFLKKLLTVIRTCDTVIITRTDNTRKSLKKISKKSLTITSACDKVISTRTKRYAMKRKALQTHKIDTEKILVDNHKKL